MQNTTLSRIFLGILLLGSSGFLFASEPDYGREREEQGGRIWSMGNTRVDEEILHLKRRYHDLLGKAKELQQSHAPESELAEIRKQMEMIWRELHMHQAKHEELPPELRARAERLEVAGRRVHHFKVAAENLKMAEAHDLAHEIMEKAESMEREVQEGKERFAAEILKHQLAVASQDQSFDATSELKKEILQLRAEVKELRQKLENR